MICKILMVILTLIITFPAIYKATNERNILVDNARKELSAVVDRYNAALKADSEYSRLQREADSLNKRIKELTEQLYETREAANRIKDPLYRPAYNAECSAIIQALPTEGKEFCKDPVQPHF
jgi:predicted  nucleic acid-binding Zn-ribbon protein